MAETRVDLLHFLEDLRDAYPGALEETMLTEIIANSLDSGAHRICVSGDPSRASLRIADDGSGMPRRDLRRYHDLAASANARGKGIGFAGVGIKLALLACKEVVTETRRGKVHAATSWHLASRHRAPWKWIPPPGLVAERGTAVRLVLTDSLSPLTDSGFLEEAIRRHYYPLLDPAFDEFLRPIYPRGITFEVNGAVLRKESCSAPESEPLAVRTGRRRKPSAAGYVFRAADPLPEEQRGIAISTYGKIIKRGWDWLGVSPNASDRIGGLVEVPELAASLTLNKGDFIRTGPRGAAYLAFRKAIQEVLVRQLAAWGDRLETSEATRTRSLRVLERDLERVLLELSKGFPLLESLVEPRRGGQKRLPLGAKSDTGGGFGPGLSSAVGGAKDAGAAGMPEQPPAPRPESNAVQPVSGNAAAVESSRRRVPARLGLGIQFEDRPNDAELGRLVESTVFINRAHPAYRRASASRSEGYHVALAVAMALAPLAVEPVAEHGFITEFMSRWGEAVASGAPPRRRKS